MTVTYTVQDRISSNEVTINVGTARYAFDLFDNKSNVGVGIGTMAESGRAVFGIPLSSPTGQFKEILATITTNEMKAFNSSLTSTSA